MMEFGSRPQVLVAGKEVWRLYLVCHFVRGFELLVIEESTPYRRSQMVKRLIPLGICRMHMV